MKEEKQLSGGAEKVEELARRKAAAAKGGREGCEVLPAAVNG